MELGKQSLPFWACWNLLDTFKTLTIKSSPLQVLRNSLWEIILISTELPTNSPLYLVSIKIVTYLLSVSEASNLLTVGQFFGFIKTIHTLWHRQILPHHSHYNRINFFTWLVVVSFASLPSFLIKTLCSLQCYSYLHCLLSNLYLLHYTTVVSTLISPLNAQSLSSVQFFCGHFKIYSNILFY